MTIVKPDSWRRRKPSWPSINRTTDRDPYGEDEETAAGPSAPRQVGKSRTYPEPMELQLLLRPSHTSSPMAPTSPSVRVCVSQLSRGFVVLSLGADVSRCFVQFIEDRNKGKRDWKRASLKNDAHYHEDQALCCPKLLSKALSLLFMAFKIMPRQLGKLQTLKGLIGMGYRTMPSDQSAVECSSLYVWVQHTRLWGSPCLPD